VPFNALSELELPGGVVDRFPRFRQSWLQLLLFIRMDQAVEDIPGNSVVRSQVVIVRVNG